MLVSLHASIYKYLNVAANLLLAHHLPLANNILVLAVSKIVEQGTWNDLRSSTGYVSQLQVNRSDPKFGQEAVTEKASTTPGVLPPSKNELLDLSRKTGDTAVYCKEEADQRLVI